MVKINQGKCPDLAQRSVVANNIEVRLTNTDYADLFLVLPKGEQKQYQRAEEFVQAAEEFLKKDECSLY